MNGLLSLAPWAEDHLSEPIPSRAPKVERTERLDSRQLNLLTSVRVELSIEIGKVALTLGELLDLSIGSRVELDLPDALPVNIAIDGVRIAEGRIIYEGGEPMVEIVKLEDAVNETGNNSFEVSEN